MRAPAVKIQNGCPPRCQSLVRHLVSKISMPKADNLSRKYFRPEQKPEREEEKKIAKYKRSVILKIELSHKSIKAQSKQKLNRSF